jgi:hypothetical protein
MSDTKSFDWGDLWLMIAVVVTLFALVAGCTVYSQGIMRNDRMKIERDKSVKVECLHSGGVGRRQLRAGRGVVVVTGVPDAPDKDERRATVSEQTLARIFTRRGWKAFRVGRSQESPIKRYRR